MLPEGIYEQIVNTRIRSEIEQIDPEQYDIGLEELQADDARRVLTIYLSYVIQKGLHYVRDQYPSSSDGEQEALLAQIRLCNDIIREIADHTQEPDFEDNLILEKGEVLTSLYNKLNTARSITKRKDAIRPETSIVENALFTGSRNEPSMLSELKKEIISADQVDLLVSFIKWSAIRPLLPELVEFTKRPGVSLRVIATTYTRATDYKAIIELAKLPNTQVRINYETNHARMHAKSYLFKRNSGFSTAYIGSSNLSNPALTGGLEWNIKVTEQESFDIVKKFSVSFESYWNDASFELFDPEDPECCDRLKTELSQPLFDKNNRQLQVEIRPYAYQQEILDNLSAEREVYGHYKNLIVAATGVGKTIIAAFDYKRFKEQHEHARLLFVAHRKEILEQSQQKFQEVLNDFNFGQLYVDGRKPTNIEHLFISIQSLNSSDLTSWTSPDYYDYIVVDEFHHAAANSYQQLLAYYNPQILLGLTATPDRMDGKDILKYFDGNIASKMLLGEAIDRNLLSTFQYFGVTDDVDYRKLNWTRGRYDINELERVYTADTRRCALILNSVQKYVADLNDVKGLGFCVSVAHADYMAAYFNQHGVPSISLSAKSVDDIRDDAKKELVSGEIKFIFVVDLYNEGVDIPQINTILFLRPTESATIFLQQFGRGLRKCDGKDCLTVLDFIGQANKKYNFAMKFESIVGKGRRSVREQVETGFANLPRGCYIELEPYAKDYILENLKQTANTKNALIENVRTFEGDTGLPLTLENYLNEYDLTLYDFYQNTGSRSLFRLKKWAGLIQDSRDVDDHVYNVITGLFHINSAKLLDYWIRYIQSDQIPRSRNEVLMRNMLYYTFYKKCPAKMGFADIDEGIRSILCEDFVVDEVLEILRYNRSHISFVADTNEYRFNCPLELHCKYNTNQIMAAFGYFTEDSSPEFREGVKWFEDKKTDIFLINLNKSEKDFSPSTMYEDYAINAQLFHWQSQSQDRQSSEKIQRYIHHRETGGNISLFIREFKKNGQYTAPYVFVGNADHVSHEGDRPVSFIWRLHTPLPADLLPKANKSIAM